MRGAANGRGSQKVSRYLLEDTIQFRKYLAQHRFLAEHRIETTEELQFTNNRLTAQLDTAVRERKSLYEERRRADEEQKEVLEGTTAADLAEVEGGKAVCRVRGGVVLPFMDGATIYDAELFELMRNACDKRGIRWQTKTRVAGGTDAGRIHKSRAGVRVCAAAAPVRYIHSPSSVAAVADCEAVLSAARAFLEELGGDDE